MSSEKLSHIPLLFWIFISLIFISNQYFAQSDTSKIFQQNTSKKNHSLFNISKWSAPKKASVLSAIIPGAGQIYNKKYWKAPLIYAIEGTLIYNTILQNNHYQYYKQELINVLNGGRNQDGLSSQQLTLLKNQSKKWRDLSIAGILVFYVLNIIDANVDAHLKQFDISDDLSIKISPQFSLPSNTLNFDYAKIPVNLMFSLNLKVH